MDLTLSELSVLQIIVFLTVVEKKGITKAADELHMTQPAVLQSIFSLEKKLEL